MTDEQRMAINADSDARQTLVEALRDTDDWRRACQRCGGDHGQRSEIEARRVMARVYERAAGIAQGELDELEASR